MSQVSYLIQSVHLAEARYRSRHMACDRIFRREAHDHVPTANSVKAGISHVQAQWTLNGVAPIDSDCKDFTDVRDGKRPR